MFGSFEDGPRLCVCVCARLCVWVRVCLCLPLSDINYILETLRTCDLEDGNNNDSVGIGIGKRFIHISIAFHFIRLTANTTPLSTYPNMLQQCTIKAPKGALGLNLSRAPWDPYPWVSGVQAESNAHRAGVCIGDTLLQLNGIDVLGMRISELATRLREHWLTGADHATMMMWRQQPSSPSPTDDPTEAAHAVVS